MRPAAVYIVAAAETSDGCPLVNADGAATSIAVHRTAPRVRTAGSRRSTGDSTPLDETVRGSSDASMCVVRPYQPSMTAVWAVHLPPSALVSLRRTHG